MMRFFRGYAVIEITGANPARCLNRFSSAGIAFWNLEQPDALQLRCRIYRKDLARAKTAALRAMCTLELLREDGFPSRFGGLRRRPVLVLGVVLAFVLTMMAQKFIWIVRVEGCETISMQAVLHALAEEGVGFGSYGPDISSPHLRMRLQLRLPELQWAAANQEGGVLTVLVRERHDAFEQPVVTDPANVVASRAGIVTSVSSLRGTAAVEVGDAVGMGELLISGITTWERGSQLTRAAGEVYAQTSHQVQVKTPESCLEKCYTGEVSREVCLILGRNRRKIFGNSRISHSSCDKIVNRKVCTLPGGDTLPVIVEVTEYRYYETEAAPLREDCAQALLERFAIADVKAHMIAGTVGQTAFELTKEKGCYVLRGDLSCEEMISRTAPISLIGEDITNGEADQRGTN